MPPGNMNICVCMYLLVHALFMVLCVLFVSENTKEKWLSLGFRGKIWIPGRKLTFQLQLPITFELFMLYMYCF